MADYLAHSAKNGHPEQTYQEHILNVHREATRFAKEAEVYAAKSQGQLSHAVHNAAVMHDLGKLDKKNQVALHTPQGKKQLPVNHVDAGTTKLLQENDLFSATAIYAHHHGLPDMEAEQLRGPHFMRDNRSEIRSITDEGLEQMMTIHCSLIDLPTVPPCEYTGDPSVFFRLMLSCVVDADHSDTARHYQQYPWEMALPLLQPAKRLAALNAHVATLGSNDERSQLRREMYEHCRDAEASANFSACDSPVGSGKTTAVMAHLLKQAEKRNARRIFVVLPYTSIITQSVKKYREYLTLPGEDPETVVAELHSRAEFEDTDVRYLTALWRAPIIVTTAVAFFETLASSKPSALRKLHELPGSVLFIDEAHAALPIHLLPLAWHWMNVLANEWGCYWVLASGSLVRYWNIQGLIDETTYVPDLVVSELQHKLMQYEENRIAFKWDPKPLSRQELIQRIFNAPGPRLLIVNTVQNAAVLADDIQQLYGRACVEHLSTALTPNDRNAIIERIQNRLSGEKDTDWVLVATSCVEAGVDFSFRTGYREVSSLLSLLQAAGRVNRHGKETNAEMWSFVLQDSEMLNKNKGLETSAAVLTGYLNAGEQITPVLSTRSMQDELCRNDNVLQSLCQLSRDEGAGQFDCVCQSFQVIENRTVTAVTDPELITLIQQGKSDWQQMQLHSVSVPHYRVEKWQMREIAKDLYEWTLPYDSFLGYMAGVLAQLKKG